DQARAGRGTRGDVRPAESLQLYARHCDRLAPRRRGRRDARADAAGHDASDRRDPVPRGDPAPHGGDGKERSQAEALTPVASPAGGGRVRETGCRLLVTGKSILCYHQNTMTNLYLNGE